MVIEYSTVELQDIVENAFRKQFPYYDNSLVKVSFNVESEDYVKSINARVRILKDGSK